MFKFVTVGLALFVGEQWGPRGRAGGVHLVSSGRSEGHTLRVEARQRRVGSPGLHPHSLSYFSLKLGEGLRKGFSAKHFAFHLGSVRLQPASCRHQSLGWLEVLALAGQSATCARPHAGLGLARETPSGERLLARSAHHPQQPTGPTLVPVLWPLLLVQG